MGRVIILTVTLFHTHNKIEKENHTVSDINIWVTVMCRRVVRPWIGLKMLDLNDMIVAQLKERDPSFPVVSKGVLVPVVCPLSIFPLILFDMKSSKFNLFFPPHNRFLWFRFIFHTKLTSAVCFKRNCTSGIMIY